MKNIFLILSVDFSLLNTINRSSEILLSNFAPVDVTPIRTTGLVISLDDFVVSAEWTSLFKSSGSQIISIKPFVKADWSNLRIFLGLFEAQSKEIQKIGSLSPSIFSRTPIPSVLWWTDWCKKGSICPFWVFMKERNLCESTGIFVITITPQRLMNISTWFYPLVSGSWINIYIQFFIALSKDDVPERPVRDILNTWDVMWF